VSANAAAAVYMSLNRFFSWIHFYRQSVSSSSSSVGVSVSNTRKKSHMVSSSGAKCLVRCQPFRVITPGFIVYVSPVRFLHAQQKEGRKWK
jgi:hypothetical protein